MESAKPEGKLQRLERVRKELKKKYFYELMLLRDTPKEDWQFPEKRNDLRFVNLLITKLEVILKWKIIEEEQLINIYIAQLKDPHVSSVVVNRILGEIVDKLQPRI